MDKIVAYFGTRNIYNTMIVAAKSLLYNTPVDSVYFFIEDDDIGQPVPDIIHCVNVSQQPWFPRSDSTWTYMANMRFTIGKLIPDASTVLYLDTDTLVLKNITPMFYTDLQHSLFGMVMEDVNDITLEYLNKSFSYSSESTIVPVKSVEARPSYPIHPYYNSGVMLINVTELVTSFMDETLIDAVNSQDPMFVYPDQDAINLLCHDKIVPLPLCYNVISNIIPDFPHEQIAIKHYASDKPLWKSSLWQYYNHLQWEHILMKQTLLKEGEHIGR